MTKIPDTFPIFASETVQACLYGEGLVMQPHRPALHALANNIGAQKVSPENPRVLLLNSHENPNTKTELQAPLGPYHGRVPTIESDDDLVIRLPEHNVLSEEALTTAFVVSLLRRRQLAREHMSTRVGSGVALGGVALFTAGTVMHNNAMCAVGGSITVLSAGVIGHIRSTTPRTPDITGLDHPITLTSNK